MSAADDHTALAVFGNQSSKDALLMLFQFHFEKTIQGNARVILRRKHLCQTHCDCTAAHNNYSRIIGKND
jgi:hypothetical protein